MTQKILKIYVQPNARETAIIGPYGNELKIALKAPAHEGKANEALIEFLAKHYKIPKKSIAIKSGLTSRHKLIVIK